MPPPISIKLLRYADDIAQMFTTRKEASERAMNIYLYGLTRCHSTDPPAAHLVALRVKTEVMQISTMTCDQTQVAEAEITDCDFELDSLVTSVRQSLLPLAGGPTHPDEYKVDQVLPDVRGTPGKRYYLVRTVERTNDNATTRRKNPETEYF